MTTPKKAPKPKRLPLTPTQVWNVTRAMGEQDDALRRYEAAKKRSDGLLNSILTGAGESTDNGWTLEVGDDQVELVEVLPGAD